MKTDFPKGLSKAKRPLIPSGAVGAGVTLAAGLCIAVALPGCPQPGADREPPLLLPDNVTEGTFIVASHVPRSLRVCIGPDKKAPAGTPTKCDIYHRRGGWNDTATQWRQFWSLGGWAGLAEYADAGAGSDQIVISAENCATVTRLRSELAPAKAEDSADVPIIELRCYEPCDPGNSECVDCTDCAEGHSVCDYEKNRCVECTASDSTACRGAKPVCDATQNVCVECSATELDACSDAKPVCDIAQGVCVGCNAPGASPCPASSPACDPETGACWQCLSTNTAGCTEGNEKRCHPTSHLCVECHAGDTSACTDPSRSVCDRKTNTCQQCSELDESVCTRDDSVCHLQSLRCVRCAGDYATAGGRFDYCHSRTEPVCFATGGCGPCRGNQDCAGTKHAGPVCDPLTRYCVVGTPCATDANCRASEYCAAQTSGAGACAPKLANGVPLPAAPVELTTCTGSVGARVCVTGACQLSDGRCGVAEGSACSAPLECRSGKCDSGICVGAP